MKYYKIKHGVTFEFMLIGLTILLLSIVLYNIGFLIAFLITFTIGLIVFLSIKGIIINENSLKIYFSFLGLKIGNWVPIDQYNKIYLSNAKGNTSMNSRGRSSSILTNSFIITLKGKNMENIELYEDVHYKDCRLKLLEIETFLKIKSVDQIDILKMRLKKEHNHF